MKRLTRDWTRFSLRVCKYTRHIVPHPQKISATPFTGGDFLCSCISPMHCELEPVIGGCTSVNNQSKLLFIGTTPRTVREPMCDEVDCLQSRAPLVTLLFIYQE